MITKDKLLNLSRILFFFLLLIVPLNLGKHFITSDSYVWGKVIDYLIPTIYIQDIITALVIILWVFSGGINKIRSSNVISSKEIQFSIFFIFSVFLSVISSQRFIPSIYAWSRLLLYFLLFLYTLTSIPIEYHFFKILDILVISLLFVSVLGIAQFIKRGSVFDNYLVFGEQPYSASTFGIVRKNLFGRTVIPSYSVFRHPNTLGGYLSILLIWVLAFLRRRKIYLIPLLVGLVSLLLTFSVSSWVAFVLGVLLHVYFSGNTIRIKSRKLFAILVASIVTVFFMLVPLCKRLTNSGNPSIFRRYSLMLASYKIVGDYPVFGVGLNNMTVLVDRHVTRSRDIRFTQPVHNVFLLTFAESGIFSFLALLGMLFFSAKRLLNSSYFHVLLISFLQLLVIGSFDHYLFTAHQTQLLFWIILGMILQ